MDQLGKAVGFGVVEFQSVMGIIRSMKLLSGILFKGKALSIAMGKKPKMLVCKSLISSRICGLCQGKM